LPVSIKKNVPVQLVLGTQWGDEGKGKIVDILGESADIVARYQGGPNAGHTVKIKDDQYILHLIPSGILRPHTNCVIGNGVVINPKSLMVEIQFLADKGIDCKGRIFISQNAHLILPYHELLDKAYEILKGKKSLGTTGRGIGPSYADKVSRIGIRMNDLLDEKLLQEKVEYNVRLKNGFLKHVCNIDGVDAKTIFQSLLQFRDQIKDRIVDTRWMIHKGLQEGKKILLEGAQGTLLDIDLGTYPFVTSSNTTSGGVFPGLGLGFRKVDRVVGVIKAYTTRVGNGPFPTELTGDFGDKLREMGSEYGATTGRPRRCGWFDAVIGNYAMQVNDVDVLAITKLDVLDELETISICTGYKYQGKDLETMPTDCDILNQVEPVYESMPGWQKPINDIKKYDDLPQNTRNYLKRLEELLQKPIGIVSVGPHRSETIFAE